MDPELIDYFENVALDEALRESKLSARTRLLVQFTALIDSQRLRKYPVMLAAALTTGVTAIKAKEVAVLSHIAKAA